MASIYLRGKTWWIAYRIGGKRICYSLNTKNAREAREIQRKHEALQVSGLIRKPSNIPIGPFLQELCQFWRKSRKEKGAETDIGRLRGVFGPCCEALEIRRHTPKRFVPKATDARTGGRYLSVRKLEDISPEAIAAHLHDRVVRDEIGGKTANRIRSVISSMFSYARKYHGYVCPESDYKNPIEGVERFKETNPPIAWLKSEDITQQLDVLGEHPKTRALVATYIYAGLRRLEALWLMEDDIDLEERVIRIRSKTVEGEHWEPKTGQNRTVPISHKLLDELVSFLPYRQGVWFFSSPEGMRWNPDNFSQHLRKINKDSGLSWSCAEYRHTFGSHLAQKGVSLYKISGLMGNSPAICQKHYAAIEPQEMHDEVEF